MKMLDFGKLMIKKHTIFVFFLLTVTNTAYALFPAILPNKADVQATEVSPIDGDWIVSANNKRIRIDRGRAYALDTWTGSTAHRDGSHATAAGRQH